MSSKKTKEPMSVVEQELALKVYIDSLLIEPSTEAPEIQVETKPEQRPGTDEVLATNTVDGVDDDPQPLTETEPVQTRAVGTEEDPFECLIFQVAGGLYLSVPLVRLNGILPWQGECTPLPGHAEWFLGLVSNRGKQVKVIDIASFVIPENHQVREGLVGDRNFKHLILIDEGRYGLACDELVDVLKLGHKDVRWRGDRTNRPWLAGTLIDKMCALIDVDQFVVKLKEGIKLDDI